MKILVTGGAGFIGTRLVQKLESEVPDVQVAVIDNDQAALDRLDIRGSKFHCDIRDGRSLRAVFRTMRPDVVIHLAAVHFIPFCNTHPYTTLHVNVVGTLNVVRASAEIAARRFVFASSASVYGNSKRFTETDVCIPTSVYGLSKLLGEFAIRVSSLRSWSACRLFNVYGPNNHTPHLIPTIIKQVNDGDVVRLGNLETRRDYIYVDDVCSALLIILDSTAASRRIINIGCGTSYSGSDILAVLQRLMKRTITTITDPSRVRSGDTLDVRADNHRLVSLGWAPAFTLEEGLTGTLAMTSNK